MLAGGGRQGAVLQSSYIKGMLTASFCELVVGSYSRATSGKYLMCFMFGAA
jgi:hypothetical protein